MKLLWVCFHTCYENLVLCRGNLNHVMRAFNFPEFLIYNLSLIAEHTWITFNTPHTQGSSFPMSWPRVIPIVQTTFITFNVRSYCRTNPIGLSPRTILLLKVSRVWLCYHTVSGVWRYDKGTLLWKWHLLYERGSITITREIRNVRLLRLCSLLGLIVVTSW